MIQNNSPARTSNSAVYNIKPTHENTVITANNHHHTIYIKIFSIWISQVDNIYNIKLN